jgi:hypothetical protein
MKDEKELTQSGFSFSFDILTILASLDRSERSVPTQIYLRFTVIKIDLEHLYLNLR